MTQTLAVNEKNDLYLDTNGNIAMATGLIAVLQACEQAAKTLLGEMVLQTESGIPYFQVVFVGTPNIAQFKASLRGAFLGVDGVKEVISLTTSHVDDLLTYSAVILTVYGSGSIPGTTGSSSINASAVVPSLSAADYEYSDTTGVITPDTAEILFEVQEEYKDVFGADLIVTPNTPQGLLITVEALARAAVVANNCQIANQINPNISGGVFLDAIGALTNTKRDPAEYTTVAADLTGVPGTVIPGGSLAQDSVSGYQFALTAEITLSGSGTGSSIFQCTTAGAFTVAANNLTIIVAGGVLGWETVNNPAAQIDIGNPEQSDEQFRNVRRVRLAEQSTSLSEAIITALYATHGVKSLSYRENITGSTEVIDGVTLVKNSIYVCVYGGLDNEIATVLDNKKSGGCNYNGNITVNITDSFSGQVIPVKFDRAIVVPIAVRATVKPDQATQDPTNAVKDAITDYAKGKLSQEPGLTVGQLVSPWELAGAINRVYPGIFVSNIEISLVTPLSFSNANIPIDINQIADIKDSDIAVVIT